MDGQTSASRGRRHRSRDERGASAVEFALVLVPFLTLVLGSVQYGMYFYALQTGSNAADSALRQVAVGNCQSDTALKTYVDHRLSGAADGGATITRTYYNPDGAEVTSAPAATNVQVGGSVKLKLTFKAFDLHFPLISSLSDPTMSRTVQARVEDTVDEGCGA